MEFQPSSWSKGSYLNVGASWLWSENYHLSFDFGYRVEDFVEFQDESQFAPLADQLARRAAEEVARLRSLFPSIQNAARHLAAKSAVGFWEMFHTGVACGLAGDTVRARELFSEVANTDDDRDWVKEAASLATEYSIAMEDLDGFRQQIAAVIRRARVRLRLPELADINLY